VRLTTPRWVPTWARRSAWYVSNIVAGFVLLPAGNALYDIVRQNVSALTMVSLGWGWLLASLLALAWPLYVTARSRSVFMRRNCRQNIRHMLEALSTCFPQPNRTNIMLVVQTPDGPRRRVDKNTAHNMDSDPDNCLEMDLKAGVSGLAVIERAFAFGDLTIAPAPGAPKWGLRRDEQSRVRSTLKTIVSVPIVDPEHPDGDVLGTLQIDSDIEYGDFFQRSGPEAVGKIASRFADVIALLIKEGGYGIKD